MTLRLDPTYRYSSVHIRLLTTFRSQLSGKRLIDGKTISACFYRNVTDSGCIEARLRALIF